MNRKEKLVNVDVRLRCADREHKKMCAELRDTLLERFNNIKEAETTKAYGGAEDFCVIATAVINPKNKAKFERALKQLRSSSTPSTHVEDVKVEIIQ